jgi:hypothetical protein
VGAPLFLELLTRAAGADSLYFVGGDDVERHGMGCVLILANDTGDDVIA